MRIAYLNCEPVRKERDLQHKAKAARRKGRVILTLPPLEDAESVLYASQNLSLAALYYSLAPPLQLSGVY